MTRWLLIPAALLLTAAAPQCPPDQTAYVELLKTDRSAYIDLLDKLRLQLARVEAEKAADDRLLTEHHLAPKK
jgi:hypothetical protein